MNTSKLALVTPSKSSRIALILALESAHLASLPCKEVVDSFKEICVGKRLARVLEVKLELRIQRGAFPSTNFQL